MIETIKIIKWKIQKELRSLIQEDKLQYKCDILIREDKQIKKED